MQCFILLSRFMSPTTQGDIRTETVQPDALKAGTKINQQLGYGSDPQKVTPVIRYWKL